MVASLNLLPFEPVMKGTARLVRVLLVEDNKQDVYLLQQMLTHNATHYRYAFTDVPRLVEAFRRLKKQEFDVVLLDLGLLDIDGLASVSALHAEMPNVPIIVYSGQDDLKMKEKALACGASDYLVKGRLSASALQERVQLAIAKAA